VRVAAAPGSGPEHRVAEVVHGGLLDRVEVVEEGGREQIEAQGGDGSQPSRAAGSSASSAEPQRRFNYECRHPELSTLHQVVRDNLETLYAAVEAGFASAPLPNFVRRELEGFLDCGLLCRGFALLACEDCGERRLVAFSCKGRAFCPSCLGRRMEQTSMNLLDHVIPRVPLRQFVLTWPFELRTRLGYDGSLLGAVSRVFVDSVLGFYRRRMRELGVVGADGKQGKSGAVTVVQRTNADLRLNPHLHSAALDGLCGSAHRPSYADVQTMLSCRLAVASKTPSNGTQSR